MHNFLIKYKRFLISVLLGLVLFVAILSNVTSEEVLSALKSVNLGLFFAGFGFYFFSHVMRALRFHLLLDGKISFNKFMSIIFISNFFNFFLPLRLGELSYVHLVHKAGAVGFGRSVGSLISARVLDVIVLTFLFIFFYLFAFKSGMNVILWAIFILIIFVVAFFLLIAKGPRLIFLLRNKYIKPTNNNGGWFQKFLQYTDDMAEGFAFLRAHHVFWLALFYSFLAWFLTFINGVMLFWSVNLSLTFFRGMFSYAFPVFASVLPFAGFAGFGTYEGSAVAGLLLTGISKTQAITAGITVHLEEIIIVILCGLIGFLYQLLQKRS